MFLPNKVKSIAAVSLLSLGAIGSQVLSTPKAQAQSLVPMMCNSGRCNIRVRLDNFATVDAEIVPNTRGIIVPRSLLQQMAIKGKTRGDVSKSLAHNFRSITIGNKTYSVNIPARVVSYGNRVMIGENSLQSTGARRYGNTNQLILP